MTPVETALKPLAKLVAKHPQLEAQVIWAEAGDWAPQETETEGLDGEEILFYAEGMLEEGYGLAWQALGEDIPEFVRLFFWDGLAPDLPDDVDLLASGRIEASR
jgi:hypothetical protein